MKAVKAAIEAAADATAANPIFCAVDTPNLAAAQRLAGQVRGAVGGLKLGLKFFAAQGPAGVKSMTGEGLPIFLDLKLHDIPNTVAGAMREAARLCVALTTVHASGGSAMLAAAVKAARDAAKPPKVLAVTMLTSMDSSDLKAMGVARTVQEQVRALAETAQEAGCDGVVCSPQEVAPLRAALPSDFLLLVPGLRSATAARNEDQKRVDTPANAIRAGADYLVIGRTITEAEDPRRAALAVWDEVASARRARAH
ncbi:MAG: orotidine-5'-phosphate decarboxylase [Alphaproteobacteria bacterium]|nr:orotidine-5'-phosphate decarboxylase [Alphaproteobacteria bacterium]